MGDLSRFKVNSAGPLNERLQKQIDTHNDRVNAETISSNIDSALSAYVTFKPEIQGNGTATPN